MLRTSAAVAPPRRAVWTERIMFSRPRIEWASVEQTIGTPAADRLPHVVAAQVEARGQAVDLDRDPLLERDLEHALEVERVLRPAVDDPALRVAEAAHVRVTQRFLDAPGHLVVRHPLAAVHAGLDPVELGEHVVGQVEPPVREDVALDPAQDAERRQPLVRGRDLLALAADFVAGEPGDGADGRRVVADGDVLVAELARGAAHLLDARAAVRPRRVAVQVAADLAGLDEHRRIAPERSLAQLRRAPRDSERAIHGRLVGRVRQRFERDHVLGRAGRAHERGPEPLRRDDDELDRQALDRHADRPPGLPLDHGDDLRQRLEARDHRRRIGRRAHDREPLA